MSLTALRVYLSIVSAYNALFTLMLTEKHEFFCVIKLSQEILV